jgi:hypothetical protein
LDAVILACHFCYTSVTNVGHSGAHGWSDEIFDALRNDFSFASIFAFIVPMLTGRAEVKKKTTDETIHIAAF